MGTRNLSKKELEELRKKEEEEAAAHVSFNILDWNNQFTANFFGL